MAEIDESTYKLGIKKIHTKTVSDCKKNYRENKVLGHQPPEINKDEKRLPRQTRTTLAQIRSGYSPHLQTYLHQIGQAEHDLCPKCNLHPHTATHLFNCPNDPTDLNPIDLWINPVEAAAHLNLQVTESEQDEEYEPG